MPNWSRKLPYPVVTLDGSTMLTLQDAADYVQSIGDRADRNAWQEAIRLMIVAAERRGDVVAVAKQLRLALMNDGKLDVTETMKGVA